MNPQKKRLEQLKAKREKQEEVEKQLAANSKSKKKASREMVTPSNEAETNAKMSAETVDFEYSVEEDYEDDEYKNAKNENLKNLLIEEKRLKKASRLTVENGKKLSAVLEEVLKKFDEYEKCLDGILEEIAVYKKRSGVTYKNILEKQLPSIITRWKAAQQEMRSVTISFSGQIHSSPIFGNLAHYGIFILRKVLYTWAYCRDMLPKRAAPVAPPPTTSPVKSSPKEENSMANVTVD